ncbi:MAG: hypothetical protein RLZZ267_1035 [Bacillota bacterium]|jgi:copper chaperone NosL
MLEEEDSVAKTWIVIFSLVLGMMILAGCGSQNNSPRAINEETDKCMTCNMMVANVPGSTQLLLKSGKTMVFDDLGCMIKWVEANEDVEVEKSYVRDFYTMDWIEQDKATYAYDPTFATPMAYGMVSFKIKSDAETYITEQGKGVLMTAAEMQTKLVQLTSGGMNSHDDHMHEGGI